VDRKNLLLVSLVCALFTVMVALPIVWPFIAHAQDAVPVAADVVKDAATGGATDYFKVVGDAVIPTLAILIAGILAALLRSGIKYLKEKHGFDMGEAAEQGLLGAVDRGISYAEEKAIQALKIGDNAPEGAKKLQSALEYVESEVQRLGYDVLARDKLVALIEAKLNGKRAKGELPEVAKPPVG